MESPPTSDRQPKSACDSDAPSDWSHKLSSTWGPKGPPLLCALGTRPAHTLNLGAKKDTKYFLNNWDNQWGEQIWIYSWSTLPLTVSEADVQEDSKERKEI